VSRGLAQRIHNPPVATDATPSAGAGAARRAGSQSARSGLVTALTRSRSGSAAESRSSYGLTQRTAIKPRPASVGIACRRTSRNTQQSPSVGLSILAAARAAVEVLTSVLRHRFAPTRPQDGHVIIASVTATNATPRRQAERPPLDQQPSVSPWREATSAECALSNGRGLSTLD